MALWSGVACKDGEDCAAAGVGAGAAAGAAMEPVMSGLAAAAAGGLAAGVASPSPVDVRTAGKDAGNAGQSRRHQDHHPRRLDRHNRAPPPRACVIECAKLSDDG